jgi:hypothetical protein
MMHSWLSSLEVLKKAVAAGDFRRLKSECSLGSGRSIGFEVERSKKTWSSHSFKFRLFKGFNKLRYYRSRMLMNMSPKGGPEAGVSRDTVLLQRLRNKLGRYRPSGESGGS